MNFAHWQRVPLHTHWIDITYQYTLVFGDHPSEGVVMETFNPFAPSDGPVNVASPQRDQIGVRYARTLALDSVVLMDQLSDRPIGQRMREFVGPNATVVAIPPIKWARHGLFRNRPTRILNPGEYELDGSNIVAYARTRLTGETPTVRTSRDRRAVALNRVDEIKEEYGELLSDIVYRIDYPALFDTAVPATEQFQTALVRLDQAGENPPLDTLESLVNDLEISYSVARDNAETLGARHLPEHARDDARRASKAARLAANAGTEGERLASLAQVRRILGSLALYYLPTVDDETLAIEPQS